eukprot:scpid103568/ scgid11146/ 
MSLDENADLALFGYQDLINLGELKSVDQASSLSRPELVKQLREKGVGVLPQPATTHGMSVVEDQRNSLAVSFASMSAEFVSMKEDRDDTILSLKLEVQELKREIKELRQQHIAHTSVPQPNMERKSYSTVTSGTVPTTTTRVQSAANSGPNIDHPPIASMQRSPMYTSPSAHQGNAGTEEATETVSATRHSEPRTETGTGSTHPHHTEWQEYSRRSRRPSPRPENGADNISEALRSTVTSRYVKKSADTEPADDPCVLIGVMPIKKLVIYLGSIKVGCNAESIRDWCATRYVEVLNCSIMESKYLGTAYARVNVHEEHQERVLDRTFWPEAIRHTVRKWRFRDSSSTTSPT